MPKYRDNLPQLAGKTLLTDGGLETVLIFHDGYDLPEFAAYVLLETREGEEHLKNYLRTYAGIARENGFGFLLEAPTWRASKNWGDKLGHSAADLERLNRAAISLLEEVRSEIESEEFTCVISGQIGPEGDGYSPDAFLSIEDAEKYHTPQIATFADTAADMISALTMTYAEEAIGVANAAKAAGIPAVISFTLETDGKLPSGQSLKDAIEQVDAATGEYPAYYMINCAHPTHFANALEKGAAWTGRIRALRANASKMSHEELDNAEELDEGNPVELGAEHAALKEKLPNLSVLGGCCGTDHRHIAEIAKAWARGA